MSSLRLVSSRKNSAPLPILSPVPFKKLPIESLEDWQLSRLRTQAEGLMRTRPILFLILVRLVDRLCEKAERVSKIG